MSGGPTGQETDRGALCVGVCGQFSPGAPAPHLQQGPFVTLGALVALLLLPVHGVVDSGKVRAEVANMALPTALSCSLVPTLPAALLSPGSPQYLLSPIRCLDLDPVSGNETLSQAEVTEVTSWGVH